MGECVGEPDGRSNGREGEPDRSYISLCQSSNQLALIAQSTEIAFLCTDGCMRRSKWQLEKFWKIRNREKSWIA